MSILELEGNPLFGRQHDLTLDLMKRYYTTPKKSVDKVDGKKQKQISNQPNLHSGARDQVGDRDGQDEIIKERDLDLRQQKLEAWMKSLDRDEEKLNQLRSGQKKLEEQCEQLDELKHRKQSNASEIRVHEGDMADLICKKSATIESLNKFGEEKATDFRGRIQDKNRKLDEMSRALEDRKRTFSKNSVEYLKEKGLYELTTPSTRKSVPVNKEIPIGEFETHDPGFKNSKIVKENLEALEESGYEKAVVVVKKHEVAFSVEIPTPNGNVSITCCGSDKNDALKKLMDELQKTLLDFRPSDN